jgi:hypothetical protein
MVSSGKIDAFRHLYAPLINWVGHFSIKIAAVRYGTCEVLGRARLAQKRAADSTFPFIRTGGMANYF